jgi:UDP-GlcNAc:undecaprenyl-phosphate GlcNAc-1-phosphate transferase
MDAIALSLSLATAMLLGGVMVVMGGRLGLVDLPDSEGLKTHQSEPVVLGGTAVLVGLHVGLVVAGLFDWGLFAATLGMWAVGLVDDRAGLDPKLRLLAAGGAGVLLVAIGDTDRGWQLVPVAALLVIVTVNAVNLLDGLDALAGSVTAVVAIGLAVLAAGRGLDGAAAGAFLAAALVGFLVWNLPPARMFLGDNGAYVVGVTLAWLTIRASPDWGAGLVSVAVIGIPLLDLAVTVIRRMRSGLPLLAGDRDHSYDRFHGRGVRVGWVAVCFVGAQAVWSGLIIATSVTVGDLTACVVALVLGLAVVGWLGWRRPGRS